MDFNAALDLAIDVSSAQPIGTTLHDASLLYPVYQAIQANKFDPGALADAGKLEPTVAAAARSLNLLDKLLSDKAQGPRVVALLKSL